jgi:hypothetical protein
MDQARVEDMAASPPIRIVLASMPKLLQQIVRDLLTGESNLQIDHEVASLHSLSESAPPPSAVVVIEADPPKFAEACEILPDLRLVGIARDGRHASVHFSVHFNELSRESLRRAIRCVASEDGA